MRAPKAEVRARKAKVRARKALERWGCFVALVWLLVFAGGVLIDSCPFRHILAANLSCPADSRDDGASPPASNTSTAERERAGNQTSSDEVGPLASNTLGGGLLIRQTAPVSALLSWIRPRPIAALIVAFFVSVLSYPPLNIALLSLLAGFVGGCASFALHSRLGTGNSGTKLKFGEKQPQPGPQVDEREVGHPQQAKEGEKQPQSDPHVDKLRELFLTESPFASALRGFFVYLSVLGGVYAALGNPFPNGDAQIGPLVYTHLAGIVSFLAFIVGYEPMRIRGFLDLIPGSSTSGR